MPVAINRAKQRDWLDLSSNPSGYRREAYGSGAGVPHSIECSKPLRWLNDLGCALRQSKHSVLLRVTIELRQQVVPLEVGERLPELVQAASFLEPLEGPLAFVTAVELRLIS
jgi:hypothetical protein